MTRAIVLTPIVRTWATPDLGASGSIRRAIIGDYRDSEQTGQRIEQPSTDVFQQICLLVQPGGVKSDVVEHGYPVGPAMPLQVVGESVNDGEMVDKDHRRPFFQ